MLASEQIKQMQLFEVDDELIQMEQLVIYVILISILMLVDDVNEVEQVDEIVEADVVEKNVHREQLMLDEDDERVEQQVLKIDDYDIMECDDDEDDDGVLVDDDDAVDDETDDHSQVQELDDVMLLDIEDDDEDDDIIIILLEYDEIDINEQQIYVIQQIEVVDLLQLQVEIVVILVIDIVYTDSHLIEHSLLQDKIKKTWY